MEHDKLGSAKYRLWQSVKELRELVYASANTTPEKRTIYNLQRDLKEAEVKITNLESRFLRKYILTITISILIGFGSGLALHYFGLL